MSESECTKWLGCIVFLPASHIQGWQMQVVAAVLVEVCQLQLSHMFAFWFLHIKCFHFTTWKSCQCWNNWLLRSLKTSWVIKIKWIITINECCRIIRYYTTQEYLQFIVKLPNQYYFSLFVAEIFCFSL